MAPPDAPRPATPPAEAKPPGEQLYEGTGLVLDKQGVGPQLCLGMVFESDPPQCRGIPLVGWDWARVEGERTKLDTTWGSYRVVGTYDGHRMTPTEAAPPPRQDPPQDRATSDLPCPEPKGGWTHPDPSKMDRADLITANMAAQQMPGFAALWLHHQMRPTSEQEAMKDVVLTVAFTGQLAAREAELRKLWGGALCVTRHEHTEGELGTIRIESEAMIRELGIEIQSSDLDVIHGKVLIDVTTVTAEQRAKLHQKFGEALVVTALLRPLP